MDSSEDDATNCGRGTDEDDIAAVAFLPTFKDQFRDRDSPAVDPPGLQSPKIPRRSKQSDPPSLDKRETGPEYKDQVRPGGTASPSQSTQQPGAQRVRGTTPSVSPGRIIDIAAELVDSHAERQRLEADLRPVIENEVLQNLRATIPAAVVVVADGRKKIVAAVIMIGFLLVTTSIVLGVAIPLSLQKNNEEKKAPNMPPRRTTSPTVQTTVPPTLAPTRTRFSLSQLGSDIQDFPSFTSCLATSSDGTVVAGCESFSPVRVVTLAPNQSTWNQLEEVWNDTNARSVDLSGDGTLLALGTFDGVQIFRFEQDAWINVTDVLTDILSEADSNGNDFGAAVVLSKDGSFLAVGAPFIDQVREMGHVTIYEKTDDGVFVRNGNVLFGLEELDHFGQNLAFSADGSVLAVAAPQDMSGQRDSVGHGYVRTFQYDGSRYIPLAQLLFGATPRDTESSGFGAALALSNDGRVLAAGGRNNDFNVDIYNAGHVRVFNFTNDNGWVPLGGDITGETNFAQFGTSVALSSDGLLLAVGAPGGIATTGNSTGFVRLYGYDSESNQWSQIGNDIYGRSDSDQMGEAVALADNGSKVIAGARNYVRVFEIAHL